jgi:uncharacterized protein DUF4339/Yip1-like protein
MDENRATEHDVPSPVGKSDSTDDIEEVVFEDNEGSVSTASWMVAKDKTKSGPFPDSKVLHMLQSGALAPTDMVWREGMSEWKQAAEVPELAAICAPLDASEKDDIASQGSVLTTSIRLVKSIFTDPTRGLTQIAKNLDRRDAISVGLTLLVVAALLFFCSSLIYWPRSAWGVPWGGVLLGIGTTLRLLIVAVASTAVATVGLMICHRVLGARCPYSRDLLVAGACLVPAGLMMLLLTIVNWSWLTAQACLVGLFALQGLVLHAGFRDLYGIPERRSAVAVPVLLFAVFIAIRTVYRVGLGSFL